MLHLLTHSKNSKNKRTSLYAKKMSSVMPVGLSHLNCVNVFFFCFLLWVYTLFYFFWFLLGFLFFIGFFIFYWVFYFIFLFFYFFLFLYVLWGYPCTLRLYRYCVQLLFIVIIIIIIFFSFSFSFSFSFCSCVVVLMSCVVVLLLRPAKCISVRYC